MDIILDTIQEKSKPGMKEWEVWAEIVKNAMYSGSEQTFGGSYATGNATEPQTPVFTHSDQHGWPPPPNV